VENFLFRKAKGDAKYFKKERLTPAWKDRPYQKRGGRVLIFPFGLGESGEGFSEKGAGPISKNSKGGPGQNERNLGQRKKKVLW